MRRSRSWQKAKGRHRRVAGEGCWSALLANAVPASRETVMELSSAFALNLVDLSANHQFEDLACALLLQFYKIQASFQLADVE